MAERGSGFRSYPLWVKLCVAFTALVALVAVAALTYGLCRLDIDEPVVYEDPAEHFKYGSLGGERGYYRQVGFGLPYWIWIALPELFPEYLPEGGAGRGYAAFGYIYEPGRDPRFHLPVGTSRRNVMGIDRVWLNCGSCHTGTVREAPGAEPMIVLGMPANRYDQGRWAKFLFDVAGSEKFSGEHFLATIDRLEAERRRLVEAGRLDPEGLPPELGALDRLAFRYVVGPILRKRLLLLGDRLTSFVDVETWGPGRVDTWNTPKALLSFPMKQAAERWPEDIEPELQGNVDFPSVWFQDAREDMQLHWDGNNVSVDERNLSASFAATTPPTLDKCSLLRIKRWLGTAEPPPFPEERIDWELVARGEPVYGRYCAGCHGNPRPPFQGNGAGGAVGKVVPIAKIGTDRRHLDSYTLALAQAQGTLYAGYPLAYSEVCPDDPEPDGPDSSKNYPARFHNFRKTNGYANAPLDGLWLRAPYLHNGSVPDLRALLEPSDQRPREFWIGYDVYDYDRVGFVTSGPEAERHGWRYVVSCPQDGQGEAGLAGGYGAAGNGAGENGADPRFRGNCNRGHEGRIYGTELPPEEKDALVEYLKTF